MDFMIDKTEQIELARLITMEKALKLEIAGLKRRGRTVYSIVKEELGLKGNKQSVHSQVKAVIEERNIAIFGDTKS